MAGWGRTAGVEKRPRLYVVLRKTKDRTECGNYRGISLVATRWQRSSQGNRQSPEKFTANGRIYAYPTKGAARLQTTPQRSTIDMIFFVIQRNFTLTGAKKIAPLSIYTRASSSNSPKRSIQSTGRPGSLRVVWTLLARFGVPQKIRSRLFANFHDGMRARIRTDVRRANIRTGSAWSRAYMARMRGHAISVGTCYLLPYCMWR